MMLRGVSFSPRTGAFFALACLAIGTPVAVGQLPPTQLPSVHFAPPGQNPTLAESTPSQPPMNSKDFLKLMEEANAAKGVSIYSGNFPGARPVPKAPVVERPMTIPPTQPTGYLPAGSPVGNIAPTTIENLPPAPPSHSGLPDAIDKSRQLPLQFPPPDTPSFPPPGVPLPRHTAAPTHPADLPSSLAHPSQPNPSLDAYATTHEAMMGSPVSASPHVGSPSTATLSLTPPNFYAPSPSSRNASSWPASPWMPAPTNPAASPGYPNHPQSSWDPTAPVQSSAPKRATNNPDPNRASIGTKRTPSERQARVIASYFSNWLERTGDTSMSYSPSGSLGTFGTDQAGRFSLGYMLDPMECYEFSFLGSLSWIRTLQSIGPVDSTLQADDPDWLTNLQQSSSLDQLHSASMRSYAIHKRLITDDLGNSFFGLGVIDYAEQYSLLSNGANGAASMNIDTSNLWVGAQGGLELWRPLSQRLSVGAQANGGLYANFADVVWRANSGTGLTLSTSADKWNLAFLVGVNARARYRFNSYCAAYGGYEWTYLGGLATVDQQPIHSLSTSPSLNMTTNAGFLLQGAQCGLEFQY